MLRQFWKKYPTYNLNAMMRKRYEAAEVHHVAVDVGQLEAEVPQRDGAADRNLMVLVRAALHDVAHAAVADDLRDDVVAEAAHRVGRVGQAVAAEIELGVRLHLHEGEDLTGAVDEARPQEVVDALGLRGPRALRVVRGVRKLAAASDRSGWFGCRRGRR